MCDILYLWKKEREMHPFFGEMLSKEKIADIWDRSAETYTDAGMGSIPDVIVDHMVKEGLLRAETSVFDIGCGPGTYGLRFSSHVRNVTCLDGSPRMLERLKTAITERKLDNVDIVAADWNDFTSKITFDTVFSSLCPPMNTPESILRMESFSSDICVYISSMNDDRGSLHMDIWKEFGGEYTFNGYNTEYPFRFLRGCGRNPKLRRFDTESPYEQTAKEVTKFEIEKFASYMTVGDREKEVIENVVASHSEDGIVHFDGRKSIGLLVWGIPQDQS